MKLLTMTFLLLVAAADQTLAQPSQPAGTPAPDPGGSPPANPDATSGPPATPQSPYEACLAMRHYLSTQAQGTQDLQERTRLLQSMPECSPNMAGAPPPQPQAMPMSGMPVEEDNAGFALEVRFDAAQALTGTDVVPTTGAGIFFGHRGHSVTVGVGLEVVRLTQDTSDGNGNSASTSGTTFFVMPGLRVVLARGHDDKTELIGEADAGYGRTWASNDQGLDDAPSIAHFRGQLGPGVRYWVSRSFAVGGTAGVRFDWFTRDNTMDSGSTSVSLTSLFSSIQLIGVF